jgi:hypothetical protein
MKGVVFREFLEMVESKFGLEVVDQVIDQANVPSGAAYTTVGTYDHHELIAMVIQLSQISGVPIPDLVRTFGKHLFGRFVNLYPQFFVNVPSMFHMLEGIDNRIHVEVRKLYPDAQLPHFDCQRSNGELTLDYQSDRPFADFAEGLILGCIEHFKENVELIKEDRSGGKGTAMRFRLTKIS